MATFVLVHGAWHGAWCWDRARRQIEERGHRALALDLPGHGGDTTPGASVTLDAYVDAICGALDDQPEPVIVVGHSLGGVWISAAAERSSERIRRLVYVAGLLLPDGESILSFVQKNQAAFAGSLGIQHVEVLVEKSVNIIRPDVAPDALYNGCTVEDAEAAVSRLQPEPLPPLGVPLRLTKERWGSIPRVYIETLRDFMVPIQVQRIMSSAAGCESILTMDSDHSPFLSAAEELVDLLEQCI